MKIIETYIIWIKEQSIFAKLHMCQNLRNTKLWVVETKDDMYEVSKEFVIEKNWIL